MKGHLYLLQALLALLSVTTGSFLLAGGTPMQQLQNFGQESVGGLFGSANAGRNTAPGFGARLGGSLGDFIGGLGRPGGDGIGGGAPSGANGAGSIGVSSGPRPGVGAAGLGTISGGDFLAGLGRMAADSSAGGGSNVGSRPGSNELGSGGDGTTEPGAPVLGGAGPTPALETARGGFPEDGSDLSGFPSGPLSRPNEPGTIGLSPVGIPSNAASPDSVDSRGLGSSVSTGSAPSPVGLRLRGGRGPGNTNPGLGRTGKKLDPAAAAALALGGMAGAMAIGALGVGIANAVRASRRTAGTGAGRRSRGRTTCGSPCRSSGCGRKRRSIPQSKVPADVLDNIPMNFKALY